MQLLVSTTVIIKIRLKRLPTFCLLCVFRLIEFFSTLALRTFDKTILQIKIEFCLISAMIKQEMVFKIY